MKKKETEPLREIPRPHMTQELPEVQEEQKWTVEKRDCPDDWVLKDGRGGILASFDNSEEPNLIWAAHNATLAVRSPVTIVESDEEIAREAFLEINCNHIGDDPKGFAVVEESAQAIILAAIRKSKSPPLSQEAAPAASPVSSVEQNTKGRPDMTQEGGSWCHSM